MAARRASSRPRPAPPPPAVPGSTARERHSSTARERHSTTTREPHAPLEPPAPERHQNSTSEQELEYLVEHERLRLLIAAHERKNPALSKIAIPVSGASSAASAAVEAARQTEQKMRAIAKEGRERTDELRRLGAPIAKSGSSDSLRRLWRRLCQTKA